MKPYLYAIIVLLGTLFLFALGSAMFFRTQKGRGVYGELKVRFRLGISRKGRRIMNGLVLKTEKSSTEIDHLVICKHGVFVIETKNYSGEIYGKEGQHDWTQSLAKGSVKNMLYNPVMQNANHVSHIRKLLPKKVNVKGLVVFVQNNTQNIDAESVIPLTHLRKCLRQKSGTRLKTCEIEDYYHILQEKQCKHGKRVHRKNVEKKKKYVALGICPLCHSPLVERQGKNGDFLGCSGYPQCQFTAPAPKYKKKK